MLVCEWAVSLPGFPRPFLPSFSHSSEMTPCQAKLLSPGIIIPPLILLPASMRWRIPLSWILSGPFFCIFCLFSFIFYFLSINSYLSQFAKRFKVSCYRGLLFCLKPESFQFINNFRILPLSQLSRVWIHRIYVITNH